MNWYYALGDQRQGPVSDAELDALISSGKITENTLVWKEGMVNWQPLKEVRSAAGANVPPGWIRCTATGRYFPPEEIVYLDGKPYSAAAKESVLQGVLQTGALPVLDEGRNGPPWENRDEIGFFQAIIQTVKDVLLDPATTFERMRREGGVGNPLGYYVLLTWLGFIAAAIYNVVFQGFVGSLAPHNSQMPFNPAAMSAVVMGVLVFIMPVVNALFAFIMAGAFHLTLMLCGGAQRPFETTFRTYCYSFGSVAVLQLIPMCGGLIGFVWAIVAMCIGVAKTQEITSGKAVLSVLLGLLFCCVTAGILYGGLIAVVVGATQAGSHH